MQPFTFAPKTHTELAEGPPADPAIAAARLAAIQASRPLRPPPFIFAPRRLGTGARQAQLDNARVVGLRAAPNHEHAEAEHEGDGLSLVKL